MPSPLLALWIWCLVKSTDRLFSCYNTHLEGKKNHTAILRSSTVLLAFIIIDRLVHQIIRDLTCFTFLTLNFLCDGYSASPLYLSYLYVQLVSIERYGLSLGPQK